MASRCDIKAGPGHAPGKGLENIRERIAGAARSARILRWDREKLAEPLAAVSRQQGRLIGHMEALGFQLRQEAVLQTLTADVIKTSEIEGEKLDAAQVRSSIARRLGMEMAGMEPAGRHIAGYHFALRFRQVPERQIMLSWTPQKGRCYSGDGVHVPRI